MTLNELVDALVEYRDKGAGNVHVFAVPETDDENIMKAQAVRYVFPSVQSGRTLNIFLGIKEKTPCNS